MTDPDSSEFIPPGAIRPSGPIEYWAAVGNIEQVQQSRMSVVELDRNVQRKVRSRSIFGFGQITFYSKSS